MKRVLCLLPLLAALGACASRGPALDRLDAEALFNQGLTLLRDRDWTDAITVFERFTLIHPTHPRVAEARFRLGEAYMGKKEYVTAAMEFNRLAGEFPAGPWADDARFQVCRAYNELSPPPQLDQEYTRTAIDHCRSLIAYYPDSEFVARAQGMIDRLVSKLAEKDFRTAENYFRLRAFDSANIYYETVAAEYPTTSWAPRALLRLHQSYRRLGYDQEAQAAKERLQREFPDSPEAKQVDGITADSAP